MVATAAAHHEEPLRREERDLGGDRHELGQVQVSFPQLKRRKVHIDMVLPRSPVMVMADRLRLEQVIITGVRMTKDLRIAKIYFSIFSDHKNSEDVAAGFKSARGYVKRHLAGRLGLRYMPEFQFYYDDSLERGSRIDQLIQSVQRTHETDNSTIEK